MCTFPSGDKEHVHGSKAPTDFNLSREKLFRENEKPMVLVNP